MIIQLSTKTPGLLEHALSDLRQNLSDPEYSEFMENEFDRDVQLYDAEKKLERFIKYGEVITIEVDLSTGRATVMFK